MKLGLTVMAFVIMCKGFSQTSSTNNTLGTTGITSINSTTNAAYKLAVGGAVKLFGTGTNVVGSPTFYLTNTTATTGRNYFINSDNTGLFQIIDGTTTSIARLIIDGNGNVGIGTLAPGSKLHVNGNATLQGANPGVYFLETGGSNNFQMGLVTSAGGFSRFGQPGDFVLSKVNAAGNLYISNQQNGAIHFTTGTSYSTDNIVMSVVGNNVGINTTDTKGYKLAVNGSAIFTQAVVKLYANWPDYIFGPQYKLLSLASLEAFIKANNHLPDMPTTNDVEENGIDLGNNQVLLLKKTEELTLYVIDQNKKIEEQQSMIELLQKQLEAQKAVLDELEKKIRK